MSDLRWIVPLSFASAEWQAYRFLLSQGIEAYLPYVMASARRNRWDQGIVRPQFPGYLFACLSGKQNFETIRKTIGVRELLRSGPDVVLISQKQMDDIRAHCEERARESMPRRVKLDEWKVGDVRPVPYGPYVGTPVQIETIDKSGEISASMGSLRITFRISAGQQSARQSA
jgi:transcription antitermination factor NusG